MIVVYVFINRIVSELIIACHCIAVMPATLRTAAGFCQNIYAIISIVGRMRVSTLQVALIADDAQFIETARFRSYKGGHALAFVHTIHHSPPISHQQHWVLIYVYHL